MFIEAESVLLVELRAQERHPNTTPLRQFPGRSLMSENSRCGKQFQPTGIKGWHQVNVKFILIASCPPLLCEQSKCDKTESMFACLANGSAKRVELMLHCHVEQNLFIHQQLIKVFQRNRKGCCLKRETRIRLSSLYPFVILDVSI